jgi:lipoprotein-releasing system permease protein
LNPEFYIAKKLTHSEEKGKSVARPMVKIAVFAIALGLAVMIVSLAVITGFKEGITNKVSGFGGHIVISNFDTNQSFETVPINKKQVSPGLLKSVKGIEHAQVYITKSGIIKTKDNIQAIILKGVDENFQWDFLKKNLVEGTTFSINDSTKSNNALISESIANLLQLSVGERMSVYFVQEPPRVRRFTISGIYKTSIEEFDKTFIMVDYKHLQKLNGWNDSLVSGYEILIDDFANLEPLTDSVFDLAGFQFIENGSTLKIENIRQKYMQIFNWLDLMDVNVVVILILMIVVAGINMITGLLILILEKTGTIGLLKALGYGNLRIRKIFLFQSGFLIGKGLLWGNIIGLSICFLQYFFKIIPLEESTYYVDAVPIIVKAWQIIALNTGTMALIVMMLIIPSLIIGKIQPSKAIKFN